MEFYNNYNTPLNNFKFIKRDDELDFSNVDKDTTDIDKFTEEFLNYVTKNYNDFKKNQEFLKKNLQSHEARDEDEEGYGWYPHLIEDYLEPKEEENDEEKISVDKAMKHLEEAKQMLNEITTIIKNTRLLIHKRKVGTLQGLTRQVIAQNEIEPDENNENYVAARAELDRPYNELEDIGELEHIEGGKNKRVIKTKKRKTNKKINKKSRKTNKYKY